MPTYRAVQVPAAGAPFELVERTLTDPGPRQVRIKVHACGICHSDVFVKEGHFPGLAFPRVPGHEVAGEVDAVGAEVTTFKPGDRVGVGWYGGHCGTCEPCRRGDFIVCRDGQICGISYDGGYAEYMTAPVEAVARLPDDVPADKTAPLLCAGITTFNALRHSGARPGDVVAIQGVGGLGHLGIQFANRMGFDTVALSRGADKAALARQLGAHHYVDTAAVDAAEALQALGGARVILATVPNAKAMSALAGGLAIGGKMVIVGVDAGVVEVSPLLLVGGRRSIGGWPSGTAADSEDTVRFANLTGVETMIETYPLEKAAEAYDRMLANQARFRVVLTMGA